MSKKNHAKVKPLVTPHVPVNTTNPSESIAEPEHGNSTQIELLMQRGLSETAARLESDISQEGHPSFRYRLETVAHLAAVLLKNGDGYRQAAQGAIALLDACKAELIEINEREVMEAEWTAMYDLRKRPIPAEWTIATWAKFVTGQKEDSRARPAFRQFFKYYLRRKKAITDLGLQRVSDEDQARVDAQYKVTEETGDEELRREFALYLPNLNVWACDILRQEFIQWNAQQKSKLAREKGLKSGGRPRRDAKFKS